MKTFVVSVEKAMYSTGTIEIKARNAVEAQSLIEEQINDGSLQTIDIDWSEPQYEDLSFKTTGDVD